MSMISMMSLLGMMSSVSGKVTTEELKAMDMNDLLDFDMEAVEELPDYVTPPRGYYALEIPKVEQKTVETNDGDVETFVFTWSVKRTIELTDAKDAKGNDIIPVEEGSLFTSSYMQGQGIQRLIKLFNPVAKENNCKSLRELIGILPTLELNAVIDHRFAKDDRKKKENPYPDISSVTQA